MVLRRALYHVGCHLSRTLKKFLCPSRGSNRGPFDLEASTLPRRYISRLVPQGSTNGRTHGAPFRGYGYVPLRNGGTSLREWEHNKAVQVYYIPNLYPVTFININPLKPAPPTRSYGTTIGNVIKGIILFV